MHHKSSTVGVRELRQNLSVYLARVKKGETLSVTEHNRVVATLRPAPAMTLIERLVAEGRATAPTRSFRDLPPTPRFRSKVRISDLLRQDREDRF
jgi:prevent-host-death family protein